MGKKLLGQIFRIVISISLIAFLLYTSNLAALAEALKTANIWSLLLALLLAFSQVFMSAYRWRIILSPKDMRVPLSSLTSFYFSGTFFNKFLPTVFGGDIVRAYELARFSGKAVDSAATVLIERIVGFTALFVICWISLAFGFQRLEGTSILLIVVAMSFAFLLSLAVLFNARLMDKTLSLTRFVKRWNLEDTLKKAYNSLHSFTAFKGGLLSAFVVSLVAQLVGIASAFLVSQALGLNVPFVYFLVVVPIIWVITMVPISIGGLGIREGAFVFFFTQVGVSTENALLLSVLWWGLTLIIAMVGGMTYGLGRYRRSSTLDTERG